MQAVDEDRDEHDHESDPYDDAEPRGAAVHGLNDRHHEHADEEADEANSNEDPDILVLKPAEHDLPGDDGDGDDEAEHHVTEIAAEEAIAVAQFDRGRELLAEIRDRDRVGTVDHDRSAFRGQLADDRALFHRERHASFRILAGRFQGQRFFRLLELNEPLHRERQRRGGEGAPFLARQAPIVDVIGERRRNALGRMEQRDDGAALGIAADRAPGHDVVDQQHEQAEAADEPLAVIQDLVPEQRVGAGRLDRRRGKRGDHGQVLRRARAAAWSTQ